ncbi:MAG TPA: Crp/Fnr family transcriptional regulator [Solirubrobacteraceae bacterium]|nr:Crp/Fnr family transcriptional regulator [Solirubrobacteraceae bacterium]
MKRLGPVQLLDEDPALLDLLPVRERPAARRALSAMVYRIPAGRWQPDALTARSDPHLGLLVLEGLLIRDVSVAATTCGELVGPGELLRPWDNFGERAPMPVEIEWKALEPLRVAVLDHEFAAVLASWPVLVHAFIERAVERSLSLALHVAIHCIRRVDVSLLVLFAHLADRFGKVTTAGIVIPIKLTQEDLGKLVGATRQSISLALGQLSERGSLTRRADGTWVLEPDAPVEIERMLSRRRMSPVGAPRPSRSRVP